MSFLGTDGFTWGLGVVEDRFDPEQLGRVRVRWLGIHTDEKEQILTKDLPWSTVMQPATSGAVAGVGETPNNLVEGMWVVGFTKNQNTLQDWIIMGTLPGNNTITALAGTDDKKWAKNRGDYKEFLDSYSSDIPASAKKYKDYEKGFADPTVDQRNIPYPPSDITIGHSKKFADYSFGPGEHYPEIHEGAIAEPQAYYVNSPGTKCGITETKSEMIPEDFPDPDYIKIPRVPNYKPAGLAPNDLDACDDEKWDQTLPELKGYSPKWVRVNHSDILHYLYRTTRRVTGDLRQFEGWTAFGTFAWPDVQTYGYRAHLGVNLSTGYLEDGHWRADKEAGKPGGTFAPTWPITRATPTYSIDGTDLTGIDPTESRASWGYASGSEIGYFLLEGEEYRLSHPRTPYIQKGKLGPSQRQQVKNLFESGHYGTGIYNISDPTGPDARRDIKWKDVKETDLVVLPEKDTNRLAEGGIPIKNIDGNEVTTKASLYGDQTKYFSQPDESVGKNVKPLLQAGDVIMISGVRGAEEYNGRVYRIMTLTDNGDDFKITLGTMDGIPWSGPGSIEYGDTETTTPSIIDAVDLDKDYYAEYSSYLGGGVIITNPHWTLRARTETRERQINIGNPEVNTGINMRFWNQPTPRYAARYPFNHVYETESGHVQEFDDTPGAERIHQMHRSGTYYEIDQNGTKVDYVKGDNYNIRIFDDYLYVKGKVAWTADDAVWIRANDRMDISAKWKIQIHSGGDLDISSKRNINMKAAGDINMQYDGHMNILGTALDPASAEFHAGTRACEDLSFFNLKTGHIQVEAIENIKMQADMSEISLKTLTDSIYLTSGMDIHEFTIGSHYTTAEGSINEYSAFWNARTAMMNVEDLSIGGNVSVYAAAGEIKAEALTGNIKIIANAAQVKIAALSNDIQMFAGDDIMMYATDDIIAYANDDVMITGKERIDIKALDTVVNIEAKTDVSVKALDGNVLLQADSKSIHVKSQLSLHLNSVGGSIYSLAFASHYMESGLNFNNLAAGNIIETAAQIHMNGPTAASAMAADPADTAIQATEAQAPGPGWPTPALMSMLAPTIDILPIDLPDAAPADGIGLALNANDPATPGSGYGGENIRVTIDTINDIIAGVSNTSW